MNDDYKMTFKGNFKYFFFIFLFLVIAPLIGFIYLLFFPIQNFTGFVKGILYCFAITGMFWLPGVLLHLSYYFNDRKRKIRLTKIGIEIVKYDIVTLVNYQNILKIEKVFTQSWRLPWDEYGLVQITTLNNKKFKITCLTINHDNLALELSRKCKCAIEVSATTLPI